jgi:[methyl-Co(III) methanol-specific corrinoid protein]:coenzyme M methyltransferase
VTAFASPSGRRARLLRALARLPVDRPPVICTGGSMSGVPAEVVARSGFSLPAAHLDAQALAGLALAAARLTGFESVGVPLCTTVEAEAFDAQIDLGDAATEARIVREPYERSADVPRIPAEERLRRGRIGISVAAVRHLAASAGDLPIVGNLIGPVSVAAAAVRPDAFFRELRARPADVHALVEHVTDFEIAFARELVAAGADVIAIHEDTTTPALVGPKVFAGIVLPHLQRLIDAIRETGARVLLHMCGSLERVEAQLTALRCDGFIPDAAVSPYRFAETFPQLAVVGNVSTFLLHQGEPRQIARLGAQLAQGAVHAVSPACGLASATPLANIVALTSAVAGSSSAASAAYPAHGHAISAATDRHDSGERIV